MCGRSKLILWVLIVALFLLPSAGMAARVKDLVSIKGIRPNQLFGYGLIVGLNGTGDKEGTVFTLQALANMLEAMGIHVRPKEVKVNNVAAVMVSATLQPFARIGKKMDVTVSSIGDAKSLQGGTLLLTPLKGVDGRVYALAQGPISVGGFTAGGAAGGGVTKNHPTVGTISGGATVEKEVPLPVENQKELMFVLNSPDFMTATRIAGAINARFGGAVAKAVDSGTLRFQGPSDLEDGMVQLLAELGNLDVTPDSIAKVIVNERTGTVVIGENVRISQVAVAHGNMNIQIKETKEVSQPLPFSPPSKNAQTSRTEDGVIVTPGAATVVTPQTDVGVEEEKSGLVVVPEGRTVGELVRALNAIGVGPRDLITILQAMKTAGALQAELEII
jgi:flagellar P-ring protein precursor FlgI